MPFAATWMDLEIIILSEVGQIKTDIIWYHLHVGYKIWYEYIYLQNRNRLIEIENTIMITIGESRGRDKLEIWG